MSKYGQQFDVNTTPKTSFGTRGGGRLVLKCSVVQIGRGGRRVFYLWSRHKGVRIIYSCPS